VSDHEHSTVQYGRTTIDYDIQRSSKRKTVALTIDPIKGVILTAPADIGVERLDKIVKDKAQWIVNRLRHVAEGEPPSNAKEFVSGESFAYLGRNYRLRVLGSEPPEPARLAAGWLIVAVHPAASERERNQALAASVRRWYLDRAQTRLHARAGFWAESAGLVVSEVKVKDQQKRWGSCDGKGVLRFNWRIIQAPMRLIDYVVAHEVVHLEHADHTKAFWARLGVIMPDYERRKEDLRRLGGRLAW